MKKRTAALCLLLVCAALFASCGGAIELSYENGAYRNEKSGAAYVMAPLCYRAISRLDAEEIAKIVGTKSEKVLYAIEGLDSSLWLTDENFDLYHSETVTLPDGSEFYLQDRTVIGWEYQEKLYIPGSQFTVPAADVDFSAVWGKPGESIS